MNHTSNWIQRRWLFRTKAVLGMVVGSLTILLAMLYLNSLKPEKPENDNDRALSFQVVKQVKTPKKPKPQPKKTSRPKPSKAAPLAPALADLGIGMSGIDLNMSAYDPNSDLPTAGDDVLGDTSNAVMTGDTVDQQPRALARSPLQYPPRAKAKEIEGYVLLSILINEDGKVEEVKVLESDPQGTFEEVAIRNIKKWKFAPARYKGKAVKTWINQPITFQLG